MKTVLIDGLLRISFAADEVLLNRNLSATFLEVMPFEVTTISKEAPAFFTLGIR